MIDTDKYEGHTPGPWTIDVHKVGEDTSAIVIESNMTTHSNCALAEVEVENKYAEADARLIADSPLLLQEVKLLRRAFHIATGHIGWGNHLGHAELRHALISVGIDADSLPWADREWEEPLPTFGGVAHYD